MRVRTLTPRDRPWAAAVLSERWGTTVIVSRGRAHDAAGLPGLVAEVDGRRVGLLTSRDEDTETEVVSLDALTEGVGVGTALLDEAVARARQRGQRRVWLVTSNDNLGAVGFYQRRGFRVAMVHPGAIDVARRRKPSIPLEGHDGIALHDEIELALRLGDPGPTDAVALEAATQSNAAVLANLLQLYFHEFAAERSGVLTEDGTYPRYRYLPDYFSDPQRHAWFVRHRSRLAGFALVRAVDGRHQMAEFFVAPAHRRAGVGTAAALAVFGLYPGHWEVAFDLANTGASAFWPGLIERVSVGTVGWSFEGPPVRSAEQAVLRFSTEAS